MPPPLARTLPRPHHVPLLPPLPSLPQTVPPTVFRDLLTLSKHRLSLLVSLSATTAYLLRSDPATTPSPATRLRGALSTTAGTFLTAASANTLNQLYERHSDALMSRTRSRPLPAARISPAAAAAFALATAASGLALLAHETNATTTGLAAGNIALYAFVYTPLKPLSHINTYVGAVVGAIPPLLGWSAASGGDLSSPRERGAWAYASILLLWQIPHFHALATILREDYARAGLRMLAVERPGAAAREARIAAAAMLPLGAIVAACDVTHDVFAVEGALLAAWMYRGAGRMAAAPTCAKAARPLFTASIVTLPVTMALMVLHRTSPEERRVGYGEWRKRRDGLREEARRREEEEGGVWFHPWETLAPFPFLPLPMLVPAGRRESALEGQAGAKQSGQINSKEV